MVSSLPRTQPSQHLDLRRPASGPVGEGTPAVSAPGLWCFVTAALASTRTFAKELAADQRPWRGRGLGNPCFLLGTISVSSRPQEPRVGASSTNHSWLSGGEGGTLLRSVACSI